MSSAAVRSRRSPAQAVAADPIAPIAGETTVEIIRRETEDPLRASRLVTLLAELVDARRRSGGR